MKINIVGDFCISPPYLTTDLFAENVVSTFNEADINIANLECPVITEIKEDKIEKTGPNLYTFNGVFDHLKKLNVTAVTLANNHIMDFGEAGLKNTLYLCEKSNIQASGVGKNLHEAAKPLILQKDDTKIAIINFCENEWSIASEDNAGANPFDIIENVKQINNVKQAVDLVMVIIHGGHEHYHLPSPRMVKQYRFLADQGADIVIGHHPHCIGGYEIYNDVPIFYSLGNFIFTRTSKYDSSYIGLILNLEIINNKIKNWVLIPTRQAKRDHWLSLLSGSEKGKVYEDIRSYSEILTNKHELDKEWREWISMRRKDTLKIFSPLNIIPIPYVGAVLRRLGANRILLTKKYLSSVLNYIRCEALHDLSKEVIESKLNSK